MVCDHHPEALVQTDWLEAHLQDPDLRIFECTTWLRPAAPGENVPTTRKPAAPSTRPGTFRVRASLTCQASCRAGTPPCTS